MKDKTLKVLEFNKIVNMLANKAESELGKNMAFKLAPFTDIEQIKKIQNQTDESVNILIKRGNPPLGGIYDISSQIKRLEIGAVLNPGDLLKIADGLRAARRFKAFMKNDSEDKKSIYTNIETIVNSLETKKYIENKIYNAIISEDEISDNASKELKNIRRKKSNKNASIRQKLNSIIHSQSNGKYLQDNIITIRDGRYVVPIKQEYRSNFPGLVHDQSSSGATLFIEPMSVVQLNNELKELELKEKEEIERILEELTEIVRQNVQTIKDNQQRLALLDFIFAKGKLALEMDAKKPLLNSNGYVNIKKGRHPLIDKEEVVPIDIFFGKDFTSLVVTGPNTGGKTVTLKTVGLLTLMTQAGLHIPTDYGSHMAVFENVFADIGDEQSIEQSLSTFSSHMTNIVNILKSVDNNCLVLFDELGAGTDPEEGAALAMSILEYLCNQNIRTIATTHYSELKLYAITKTGVENASVEFDVETLSPTYELLIGIPGKSNAFEISKRLGLQDFIINNAKGFLSKENIQFEDVISNIEKDRKKSEQNREETERLKKDISKLKEELEEKKEKINKTRKNIINEAKYEARRILKQSKKEADDIIKELRDISAEVEKDKNRRINESRTKLKTRIDKMNSDLTEEVLSKKNKKPVKNLKKGESVLILSLNQKGIVLTEPDESGDLTVQAGIMKVNVNISDLQRAKEEDESKDEKGTSGIIRSKTKTVKSELDLRGMNLEDAVLEADKYLDDTYIAGLNEVTLIHGKGTGVLRKGIKQLLRTHRHVKKYRLGKYGEGGSGVTIVELN